MSLLSKFAKFFSRDPNKHWEDGTFKGHKAKYNWKTNEMRYVFWKAGENSHTEDFWITADKSWNCEFRSLNNLTIEEIGRRNEYE